MRRLISVWRAGPARWARAIRAVGIALGIGLLGWAGVAGAAGLPPAYRAIVVEAVRNGERSEFDLGPALQRAKAEKKWLYVYLGAHDCGYCRRYEAFLDQHAAELLPHFGKYLIVDLRSALSVTSARLHLRVGDRSWHYLEFQRTIGDERTRQLVYPTVWLLDADLRPLMQMPTGTGTFQTVPEQLEILRLEQ